MSEVTEVKSNQLNISMAIGTCFKTHRVGITSLTIQKHYEGDVSAAVDTLMEECFNQWRRLQELGKTQILPDYVTEQVSSEVKNYSDEKVPNPTPQTTPSEFSQVTEQLENTATPQPMVPEKDIFELAPDFTIQALETPADGEQAVKEIEQNGNQGFQPNTPIPAPASGDVNLGNFTESDFDITDQMNLGPVQITENVQTEPAPTTPPTTQVGPGTQNPQGTIDDPLLNSDLSNPATLLGVDPNVPATQPVELKENNPIIDMPWLKNEDDLIEMLNLNGIKDKDGVALEQLDHPTLCELAWKVSGNASE